MNTEQKTEVENIINEFNKNLNDNKELLLRYIQIASTAATQSVKSTAYIDSITDKINKQIQEKELLINNNINDFSSKLEKYKEIKNVLDIAKKIVMKLNILRTKHYHTKMMSNLSMMIL